MTPIFINNSAETFTPTQSGALATIIYECCQVAQAGGVRPLVLTRRVDAAPFPWPETTFLEYPASPTTRAGAFVARADRKLFGYRYLGQRAYAGRVVAALKKAGVGDGRPLILQNDPEIACVIRRHFPKAFILHWFQNQQGSKDAFRRQFGKCVDAVAAVSSYTARWIEGHYELLAGSVHTVHNGVNADAFTPAGWRHEEKPVINFVGRTGIEKAPDLVLKAGLQLAKRTKNFRLQLLGSNHWGRLEMDDYQRQLCGLADALTAAGIEVRRPGHIDRGALPAELRKAQIHIVPSRWEEPCALTLFEGMATGLAVVASRTGGTPEVVGDAGMLFEKDSVEELTAHLWALLNDEEMRRRYGALGRRRAETLTWARTWNSLRALLPGDTRPAAARESVTCTSAS
jgi:glycosyltransferase involved in cell wall biosynthesis